MLCIICIPAVLCFVHRRTSGQCFGLGLCGRCVWHRSGDRKALCSSNCRDNSSFLTLSCPFRLVFRSHEIIYSQIHKINHIFIIEMNNFFKRIFCGKTFRHWTISYVYPNIKIALWKLITTTCVVHFRCGPRNGCIRVSHTHTLRKITLQHERMKCVVLTQLARPHAICTL